MTREKLYAVILHTYLPILGAHVADRDEVCKLCYVKWMLLQIEALIATDADLGKAFRWLGFIQGVFWCERVFTIDEMREHNRE